MIFSRFALKSSSQEQLKSLSVTGYSFNGAKETRTPDPLHAMQVLYQLSYGPKNADEVLSLSLSCRSLQRQLPLQTFHDICAYICLHTAASLPCTCT